MNLRRTG